MMRRALKVGIKPAYILADSWFFCKRLVIFAQDNGLDLVCRVKKNHWKYEHDGRQYKIGNLIKKLCRAKKKKLSRKLGVYTMEANVVFQGQKMKVFFYKQKKRGTKWNALISTNRQLSYPSDQPHLA